MSSDTSKVPVSIKTDFIQVIKDFSQYLRVQKQVGSSCFGISKESYARINKWGTISPAKASFFFEGPETADIFLIDSEGSFFKQESGELLNKILIAMKLTSDSVFICNAGDAGLVQKKINLISPKIIITLGTRAGQLLLNTRKPLELFQGKFHDHNGIRVMPTFHPSRLLKHPEYKRQVWEDMKRVMEVSGL